MQNPARPINHTIWVFNLATVGRLTGNQTQTIDGSLRHLNVALLPECTDAQIVTATARLAAGTTIAPGLNDAVVFIVRDPAKSIHARLNMDISSAQNNPRALGLTAVGRRPGLAEVFWERCMNDQEVACAIFHEAAHLMSEQDNAMHNFFIPNTGGGGVRVLARDGGHHQFLSAGDIEFYQNAIRRGVPMRTQVPP